MKFFKRKDKGDTGFGKHLFFDLGSGGGRGPGRPFGRTHGHQLPSSPPFSPLGTYPPSPAPPRFQPRASARSAARLLALPDAVLRRVFAWTCPHSRDETYETCEESMLDDTCPLCDLRDLAQCLRVRKAWRAAGIPTLYHSIRIDSVHYCDREIYLSEQRKRRGGSRFDKNGDPEDTARARLRLLCRTLREDAARLGPLVQYLKTPYMLRESNQADLARIVAVLPNLKYLDLPMGLFMDDAAFATLRVEVQARCTDLRKMKYMAGSEKTLQQLAHGTIWRRLEVLELVCIEMDPAVLRQVLGVLGKLRAVKISDMRCVDDEALAWNDQLPPFPALETLILTNVPRVTTAGLTSWLRWPEAQRALVALTLNGTSVKVWKLHEVLARAPALRHLTIADAVDVAMSAAAGTPNPPPLASASLETLHYEITAAPSAPRFSHVTSTYYQYLARALLAGGLHRLRALYVREPTFPDMLLGRPANLSPTSNARLLSPSSSPGLSPPQHTGSSGGNPFRDPPPGGTFANLPALLEVFTKSGDEIDWSRVTSMALNSGGGGCGGARRALSPNGERSAWHAPGSRGSDGSSYGLKTDALGGAGWSSGAGARKSVFISDGVGGGFMPVPDLDEGPAAGKTALWPGPDSGGKRGSLDLWR